MKYLLTVLLTLISTSVFSGNIVPEEVLKNWGYAGQNNHKYMNSFCGPKLNNIAQISYQGIKSVLPTEINSNTYSRFTLIKEVYPSIKSAQRRLTEVKSPTKKTSKHSKLCNLRQAMQFKKTVYIVHTDSSLFINKLTNILTLYTKYAENP